MVCFCYMGDMEVVYDVLYDGFIKIFINFLFCGEVLFGMWVIWVMVI